MQEYPSETLTANKSIQESLKPIPASNPEIEEMPTSAESSVTLDNDEVIDLFGTKSMCPKKVRSGIRRAVDNQIIYAFLIKTFTKLKIRDIIYVVFRRR